MYAGLPRIVFVLGKGGVGRSTVAAALGLWRAGLGERVLVFEWTVAEPIAPWFGLPPADLDPSEVSPGLSVMNYRLDAVLRQYFVDHLGLGLFYRRVVDHGAVRQLIEAAPGIAELMFIGHLWYLTNLAEEEAGLHFDRVIVDAPATGHGASILDLPSWISSMGAGGLLAVEIDRVVGMMTDPARTGAVVVSLPEDLAVEETLELVPRVARSLGRPPLAAFVNRSVSGVIDADARPAWLADLSARLSPASAEALAVLHAELRGRTLRAAELERALAGATSLGTFPLAEQIVATGQTSPREVVEAIARSLGRSLGPALPPAREVSR